MDTIVISEKDDVTQQFRQIIQLNVLQAYETNRAEASLSSLSFQSTTHPERHIWMDIDEEGASIELEDWSIADESEQVVGSVDIERFEDAIPVFLLWLSGANFGQAQTMLQPVEAMPVLNGR